MHAKCLGNQISKGLWMCTACFQPPFSNIDNLELAQLNTLTKDTNKNLIPHLTKQELPEELSLYYQKQITVSVIPDDDDDKDGDDFHKNCEYYDIAKFHDKIIKNS